jgi:tRNA(His) guanylyltransferase
MSLLQETLPIFSEHETAMSSTDRTSIGDRMKEYESASTSRRAFKGQPLIARLDGKSFHTYTRGLQRPYDKRLSGLMVSVTRGLVDNFQPRVAYVQSDEITLVWYQAAHETTEYPFDGRFQKMESLLAAYATGHFNAAVTAFIPEREGFKPALFDCRAFVVPTVVEAANCVLWRQMDCTKNAISMAAQSMFSHKSLQGLHGHEMQEKMWKEKGINFNDYPPFFKRGTFLRRVKRLKVLTAEELACIPQVHHPMGPVVRTTIEELDIWLAKEADQVKVLLDGAEPVGTRTYLGSPGASLPPGCEVLPAEG